MIHYPNAKINIGLNIVERRPDGYHNLETVFVPIPLQDALEIHASPDNTFRLKVSGTILGGRPEDNLVARAYRLMQQKYPEQVQPVDVHLFKHIPTGAGLGGGSADAAFMLKALNKRFDLQLPTETLEAYAAELGADCPFFIQDKAMYAEGIGNIFSPISLNLEGKTLVLVKPEIFVSTREAYSQVEPHRPDRSLRELISEPIENWRETVVNDFEKSVFPLYPEIAAIKDRLYDLGAVYASMSGSGSAVFGIFNQPVEHIDEIFSGYFCRQREL
jgi:4-diphosphocytidyl-2-C-methyl-D-erythritol kinase